MQIMLIDSTDDLRKNENNWKKIYYNNKEKSQFISFEYIYNWYLCFSKKGSIKIYCGVQDDQIVGYFPLLLIRYHGIKILKSLTNDHCFHSGYLVDKKYETKFLTAVFQNLEKNKRDWDAINYSFLYSFSKYYEIIGSLVLRSFKKRVFFVKNKTFTVSLEKGFNQYINEDISSNTRKNYKRCYNKICKTGQWEFQHYKGICATKHWSEFIRIEDSGWKGDSGTSIKRLESNYKCYYRKFIDMLAEKNALDVYFIEYKNKKIAGVFGYRDENIFHWAKTAYDENYKNLSPSNILIMQIIRDLIENDPEVKMFHMFPWDYGYKHKYANINTYVTNIIVFSRSYKGCCIKLGYQLKKKLNNVKYKSFK